MSREFQDIFIAKSVSEGNTAALQSELRHAACLFICLSKTGDGGLMQLPVNLC